MGVTWEDPPPPRQQNWCELLDECRANPGTWAKLGPFTTHFAYDAAADLRRGSRGDAQVGEFEITVRTADGHGYVYLRCVAWPDLKAVTDGTRR